eukprot:gene9668-13017_t
MSNNNNPPRPTRPPGPPPARPPSLGPNGEIKRPPGPPPNVPPIATSKPPPSGPPPRDLNQGIQRPPIDGVKKILPPDADKNSLALVAPPKPTATNPAKPLVKEGAISMFEEQEEAKPTAGADDKSATIKPVASVPPSQNNILSSSIGAPRGPRGLPPRGAPMTPSALSSLDPAGSPMRPSKPPPPQINPPGIPDGQPLPPTMKPEMKTKAPPPVRPPPDRSEIAAGSRGDADNMSVANSVASMKSIKSPPPPTTQPPLLRVKRPKEEIAPLKRREKPLPEFEHSDDEEEEPKFVEQPLPLGVLKQSLPTKLVNDNGGTNDNNTVTSGSVTLKEMIPGDATVVTLNSQSPSKSGQPNVAPDDSRALSEFVPEAPAADIDKYFDDSIIGQSLPRGRLTIKCVEGLDIRRKDDQDKVPRNDPYLRFRLGAAERHPWKNSATKRKQDSNPKFDDEIVYFDVLEPMQFVMEEDIQLYIELWNKSALKDEKVGSVTMSVVRFMKKPFVSFLEKVPIYYPGAKKTNMKAVLEFVYEEARTGIIQVTLYEARGLRNIDPMGKQDPYVQLTLGRHYKKDSRSVKDGRVNPYFEEETLLIWVDQENWVDDLNVTLYDQDTGELKPICFTHFSLLPYMKGMPDEAKEESYDLFYKKIGENNDDSETKEVACGEIDMRVRFLPSGKLSVVIDKAKDLQFPESYKPNPGENLRLDPYASLTLQGKAVTITKRTPADKDGGTDPTWACQIDFDVVDQYLLDVEVLNQGSGGKDVSMGATQISLLNVFRNGLIEFWTTLQQKKAGRGIREVGDIFVRLIFSGPVGIAYPQDRPDIDSFDDTLRNPTKPAESASEKQFKSPVKPPISTIPDNSPSQALVPADQNAVAIVNKNNELPPEFSDDEIMAAFKFIDLDHNNFVGAREIRHILVCMGEMITDEEIDMMISMVDMDGDGQVSYSEFRSLVLHPNPGAVDMHAEISKTKDEEALKDKQSLAGKAKGLDLNAFQRQKEITTREVKKKMITSFVNDNEVDFQYVKQCHDQFLSLSKEKRINGRVSFGDFCSIMGVEPIAEYRNIHTFYDTDESGDMDLREFLLSMMNFVDIDREERIKYSFYMFDEAKSGYITQKEVEEILRGNHMIGLASVKRKAETIMKQAHSNQVGAITLKEFVIVSKKFPNILLPAIGLTQVAKVG